MNYPVRFCLAWTFLFSFQATVPAAVIALYDFGSGGVRSVSSADSDPASFAGDVSFGSGFPTPAPVTGAPNSAQSGISTGSGNPPNALFVRSADNTTEAFAFSNSKYISFTITPAAPISLASLNFDFYRDASNSATNYFLRTDAGGDNFTTNIGAGNFTLTGTLAWTARSIDLSLTSMLQNLTTATTFRLYFYGGSGGTSSVVRFDNLSLNTSPIPEPAGNLLLPAGAVLLCLLRRRFAVAVC